MIRKFLFAGVMLFPVVGVAGPWCLYLEAEPSCRYESAEDCMGAAGRLGGYCRPNYKEFGIQGNAPLCLVTSTQRSCIYYSRSGCRRAAEQNNGGCVENTEKQLKAAENLRKKKDILDEVVE